MPAIYSGPREEVGDRESSSRVKTLKAGIFERVKDSGEKEWTTTECQVEKKCPERVCRNFFSSRSWLRLNQTLNLPVDLELDSHANLNNTNSRPPFQTR
jgi:hypothetical protein